MTTEITFSTTHHESALACETRIVWLPAVMAQPVAAAYVRQTWTVLDGQNTPPRHRIRMPQDTTTDVSEAELIDATVLGYGESSYHQDSGLFWRRLLWLNDNDTEAAVPGDAVIAGTVRAGRRAVAAPTRDAATQLWLVGGQSDGRKEATRFPNVNMRTRFGTLPDLTIVAHLIVSGWTGPAAPIIDQDDYMIAPEENNG